MPAEKRKKNQYRSVPYEDKPNHWRKMRKTVNAWYWDHDSAENLTLLPKDGVRVDRPDFFFDAKAGEISAPRGGGSGVEPKGEKQTVAFYPPLSPTSETEMAAKFKKYGGFSPVHSSSYDASNETLSVKTASGLPYELGGVYGPLHVFHYNAPNDPLKFGIDQYGSNASLIQNEPFKPLPPSGSVVVTKSRLKKWSGERKGFSPTQQGAMGNQSANQVAVKAGISATGDYHWIHMFAFTMGGIDNINPNVPENLVVGTLQANMIHEKIEAVVKELVYSSGKPVTVEYKVNTSDSTKPYNLDLHVATEIVWSVKFENEVQFEHTIELLSHNPPRKEEKQFVSEFLKHLMNKAPASSASTTP